MKIALVTGAGSGIGRAIAKKLDEIGFSVFLLGRTRKSLESTATQLSNPSRIFVVDLSSEKSLKAARAIRSLKKLDVLVHNAGIVKWGEFEKSSRKDWMKQFETNFFGAAQLTQMTLTALKKTKGSSIINISSNLAHSPIPGAAIYSATKSAMNAWAAALSQELAPIRVNSICPGVVDTPIHTFHGKKDTKAKSRVRELSKLSPLNRIGEPRDIAEAVDFLIHAKWMTGQT
ncbi:MAG: SDR family oxidoreductase, partial [Bdellovibrionales bacterium]|nr:SDR family oxidoreductase [Bdellovibrionales bacterium]